MVKILKNKINKKNINDLYFVAHYACTVLQEKCEDQVCIFFILLVQ